MTNNKKQIVNIVFGAIFLCGILIVLNSAGLGDFFSREYSGNGWSVNGIKADTKTLSFMIVGTLLSLLSGFGLIILVIKNVSDDKTL